MSKLKLTLAGLFLLFAGIVLGGYLFAQSQPRSIIVVNA